MFILAFLAAQLVLKGQVDKLDVFELDGNPYAFTEAQHTAEDWDSIATALASTRILDSKTDGIRICAGGDSLDINEWTPCPDPKVGSGLTHIFAAAYNVSGDLAIYFGGDRADISKESYFGYWFLQNEITRNHHSLAGEHKNGDVLILFSLETPYIRVALWDSSCTHADSNLTVGGCASANLRLERQISGTDMICNSTSTENKDVCVVTNEATQNHYDSMSPALGVYSKAPWSFTSNQAPAGYLPKFSFFEGGMLPTLLSDTVSCFSTVLASSRSSETFDAHPLDVVVGELKTCYIELEADCSYETTLDTKEVKYTISGSVSNLGIQSVSEVIVTAMTTTETGKMSTTISDGLNGGEAYTFTNSITVSAELSEVTFAAIVHAKGFAGTVPLNSKKAIRCPAMSTVMKTETKARFNSQAKDDSKCDFCTLFGIKQNLKSLTLMYEPLSCQGPSCNSQIHNNTYVLGHAEGQLPVYIISTGHEDTPILVNSVNEPFTVPVHGNTVTIHIDSMDSPLLEVISFDTSCSQPIREGDRFGSLSVLDFSTVYDVTKNACEDPCTLVGNICDIVGDNTLDQMTFKYEAKNCIDDPICHSLEKLNITGETLGANDVEIAVNGEIMYTNVDVGVLFEVFLTRPITQLTILQYGTVLQTILLPVSCIEPMKLQDQYGSLSLQGFVSEKGTTEKNFCEDSCDACHFDDTEDALKTLTIRYETSNCPYYRCNSQASNKFSVKGGPPGMEPVSIIITDKHGKVKENYSNVYFGQELEVNVWKEEEIGISISYDDANASQNISIHTSCAAPIVPHEHFGAISITGFTTMNGFNESHCPPPPPPPLSLQIDYSELNKSMKKNNNPLAVPFLSLFAVAIISLTVVSIMVNHKFRTSNDMVGVNRVHSDPMDIEMDNEGVFEV
eukprot:m.341169 g.341169  ORF g.341169 m.341169 type:complete len:906 (+) comp19878_c0_seq1:175-2892(+)